VERAESFIEGMDFVAFEADEKTAFAVVRALEIVGEMRDKLSHDYFGVDIRRVSETVRQDLPPLRASLEKILQDIEKDDRI
jgi:uncharacterized protein with HEPN domain